MRRHTMHTRNAILAHVRHKKWKRQGNEGEKKTGKEELKNELKR